MKNCLYEHCANDNDIKMIRAATVCHIGFYWKSENGGDTPDRIISPTRHVIHMNVNPLQQSGR